MTRFPMTWCSAAVAIGVFIALVLSVADAHAAVGSLPVVFDHSPLHLATVAGAVAVDLTALRVQHQDLTTRAAAKIAEVNDGMAADVVTRIENEHADLVRQAQAVATSIATAERAAPAPSPVADPQTRAHAWTADDTAKITQRAKAFGLTADDALAVMADVNVRSLEQATGALQDKAAKGTTQRQNPHIRIITDAGDTLRTAVESAIVLRANPQALKADAKEREMAHNWRGMSLLETGRAFIEETQGIRLRGLSRMELASVCLGMQTRAGMHTTSDFANLLANVASKRLRAAYEVAPQNWKLNAVYFKARWAEVFSKDATRDEPFNLTPAQKVSVPMMRQVETFNSVARTGYRAIRLPYEVGALGMIIVLPDAIDGGVRLDADELPRLLAALRSPGATKQIALAMPRFKASFKAELAKVFQQAGMVRAFDDDEADFSGMTGRPPSEAPFAIGEIVHRAVVDVMEEGTEAAAATAIAVRAAGMLVQQPEVFRVDRPFLFYIVDDGTGAILFQGRIVDPRAS
jgi:hypothetical protein